MTAISTHDIRASPPAPTAAAAFGPGAHGYGDGRIALFVTDATGV